MKSIIAELYNGELFPNEHIYPEIPQYHAVIEQISNEMDFWEQKLSRTDYERLEKLVDLKCDESEMTCLESYTCGFKLGMLLMTEVQG